jgi:hypothetical protein
MSVARFFHPLFSSGSDYGDNTGGPHRPAAGAAFQPEDLPFRVELWDDSKTEVERVLAVAASGAIGYAAYHAATVEYPDRYISLKNKTTVLSRWNGPAH